MRDRPEVSYRRCRFATGGGDGAREARGKNENGGTHRVDGVALTVTYYYYAGMDEGGGGGGGSRCGVCLFDGSAASYICWRFMPRDL